jgi:hypothetical protein
VNWLGRIGRPNPRELDQKDRGEPAQARVERTSPGVAALFHGLEEDGSRALLDLASAGGASLGLYGRFARQIRIADVLGRSAPIPGAGSLEGLEAPGRPYDIVLAWDVLDRLTPDERPGFVQRLDRMTAPGARLYIAVDLSSEPTTRPLRFTLVDLDRVREQPMGPPETRQPPLYPAEVERILAPFDLAHAFAVGQSLREYVAIKPA